MLLALYVRSKGRLMHSFTFDELSLDNESLFNDIIHKNKVK